MTDAKRGQYQSVRILIALSGLFVDVIEITAKLFWKVRPNI